MTASLLTVAEVARLMRVSKMTVYRLVHREELRAIKVGDQFRIRSDDFSKYLKSADTFGGAA